MKLKPAIILSVFASLVPGICSAQVFFPKDVVLDSTILEIPKLSQNDTIICHEAYTVSYLPSAFQPKWVAYNLTSEELEAVTEREGSFKKDPFFTGKQAGNNDYLHAGYDKGHMAPAADMKWSKQVMSDSFYFTNICPQAPRLNRYWWQYLEEQTRQNAKRYGCIWIICGPIFGQDPIYIGSNSIPVPESFFKAMLVFDGENYHSCAFVYKNINEPQQMSEVMMTVDELEEILQLDLFARLDDSIEETLESKVDPSVWGL